MRSRRGATVAGSLAALAFFATTPAGAFCLERTCDPLDPEQRCEFDNDLCVRTGRPLLWTNGCVTFAVQRDGSVKRGLDADTVTTAAGQAFSSWLHASCFGSSKPSLAVGLLGAVECAESRFNGDGKNANIILFRDASWPYPGAIDSFALTTVRFDPPSGAILDADIELNSADFRLTVDGTGVDLESVLAHEVGHFLGIGHSQDTHPDATMRANWNGKGIDLQSLTPDDEAAICIAYPPERTASKSCEPRHGFASECNVPVDESSEGCGVARQRGKGGLGEALFVLAAGVMAGSVRRRVRPARRVGPK